MAGLKFRVLLDSDSEKEVFRDILINDEDHFESFFKAIMQSFHFEGNQMASFYVSNDSWDKGHEISLMDLSYGEEETPALPNVMKDATIKSFLEEPDQKFILVYDFLRMWIFLIELIGYEKEGPEQPKVLFQVGMAPPEDSKPMEGDHLQFGTENEDEFDEEDEFGFDEFNDDYNAEDMSGYDEYEY